MTQSQSQTQLTSPILILGMHRSGTSCLTGCLQEAGLFLGDVNTEAGSNKKGNRENKAIMEHHEAILNRVGATWDRPPVITLPWTRQETKHLLSLLSAYQNVEIWGVKDPRTLFLLDGWKKVTTPKFVGTFRHPQEVAASLVSRAKKWGQVMDMEMGYDLWAAYNKKLLSIHDSQPFDIIQYDVASRIYNYKIIRIALKFGLLPPVTSGFRQEDLRNEEAADLNVPPRLKDIWEDLNDRAI